MRALSIVRHSCRRGAATLLVGAVLVVASRPVGAQPPAPSAPPPAAPQRVIDEKAREAVMAGATASAPKLTVPTISLADAVTQTVTNQPQIKLGLQSVATRTGSVQRERGAFD